MGFQRKAKRSKTAKKLTEIKKIAHDPSERYVAIRRMLKKEYFRKQMITSQYKLIK